MSVTDFLESKGVRIIKNADTSKISSIRAGGIADYMLVPDNTEKLILSLITLNRAGKRYKIIGGCTNVFFSDLGYCGFIVSTKELTSLSIKGDTVDAQAGASIAKILKFGAECDVRIAPELFGIPGSLGGAISNNSGAFESDLSSIFEEGVFLDIESGKILNLSKSDLHFSYRSSALKNEKLVFLYGKIRGTYSKKENIYQEFAYYRKKRDESQPKESSLGSFFKRGEDYYASKLIDLAGLKGFSVGGASVSKKHAGFIINSGYATASDVDELAKIIEKRIYMDYSITLQREAELVL